MDHVAVLVTAIPTELMVLEEQGNNAPLGSVVPHVNMLAKWVLRASSKVLA